MVAVAVAVALVSAPPCIASADATDDHPIPNRILKTPCTAEQIVARDVEPVCHERHMIDYNNKSAADQQGAQDWIHWTRPMRYWTM
ncbi:MULTISPECIES: DUF5078 domain-containing protein [unclassified Mycolicibacterium]|uniref:DUF5078 domain-containing protein n=1 Tax=unclassified Mycolicibacterium TaxID=2636767 RepID=UPI002ED8EC0E